MLEGFTTRLHRLAEGVAAGLLAVIFVSFILQIVMRYVFDWPLGWTAELSVIAWLWLILWGTSVVLSDEEEIRIDLLPASAGPQLRLVLGAVGAVCTIALFGMSLPAAYSYVSFMKVEKTSYLNLRFDAVFSIYIAFSVAVIARNLRLLVRLVKRPRSAAAPDQPPSAL